MKNRKVEMCTEINYVSENERYEMQEYINKYNMKMHKKDKIISNIVHSLKYIFYTPLSIASNVVSALFKVGGCVTSIGIPYGIYCIYKVIQQINAGVEFKDIKQTTFVCLFVIFPFIAFALSLMFEKLSDYLSYHR